MSQNKDKKGQKGKLEIFKQVATRLQKIK